ncbi:hypothetical protein ACTXIX_13950 [Glutamicibacter ardleyensis]
MRNNTTWCRTWIRSWADVGAEVEPIGELGGGERGVPGLERVHDADRPVEPVPQVEGAAIQIRCDRQEVEQAIHVEARAVEVGAAEVLVGVVRLMLRERRDLREEHVRLGQVDRAIGQVVERRHHEVGGEDVASVHEHDVLGVQVTGDALDRRGVEHTGVLDDLELVRVLQARRHEPAVEQRLPVEPVVRAHDDREDLACALGRFGHGCLLDGSSRGASPAAAGSQPERSKTPSAAIRRSIGLESQQHSGSACLGSALDAAGSGQTRSCHRRFTISAIEARP